MAEKTVPWWRKALDFALDGIRAGLGLLARVAKGANGNSAPEIVPEAALDVATPSAVEEPGEALVADNEPPPEPEAQPAPEPEAESAPETEPAPEAEQEAEPTESEPGLAASEEIEVMEPETKAGTKAGTCLIHPDLKGHSFSRAENILQNNGALIPGECFPTLEATDETVSSPVTEASAPTSVEPPALKEIAVDPVEEIASEFREEIAMASMPESTPAIALAEEPGGEPAPENAGETAAAATVEAVTRDWIDPGNGTPAPDTLAIVEETETLEVVIERPSEPELEAVAPTPEAPDKVLPELTAQEVETPTEPAVEMEAPAPEAETPAEPEAESAKPPVDEKAAEKAAAKLAAQKKKIAEADEQSPFSVFVGQVYDGPLDLLLDLIRKQDIDIYDIPIAKITSQFLAYVDQLRATDVDVAGEFIYTAALLIHIKSKMLLPRAPAGPEETEEDPRRELVERLLEHERFKSAAQMLQQKQMLEAASWTNPGSQEFKEDVDAEPEIAADTTDLVRIFRDILERARKRPMINVEDTSVTVGQMMQFLARRLTMEDKPVALRRLLSHTRSERALIALFLALLELVRLQAILLRQDRQFSEIFIKKNAGFETVMNEGMANAQDDWR